MGLAYKINNIVLFFLAAFVPFVSTWSKNIILQLGNFDILYILLVAYYIFYVSLVSKKSFLKRPTTLTLVLILFFIAQCLSGLFSADLDLAALKIYVELQFLIILMVVNNLTNDDKAFEYIFKGLAVGFLCACFIGLMQYLGYKQFKIFSSADLNANTGLAQDKEYRSTRVWGPFGNSLTFSEYLSIVGIVLYTYYRTINKNLIFAAFICGLTFVELIFTVSRTSLIAVVVAGFVVEFVLIKGKIPNLALYAAILVIGIIFVASLLLLPGIQQNGNPLIERFSNSTQDLKEGRLNLWVKGYQAFSHNVFFGVGPGNLHSALSSEGFPMTSEVIEQFDGQHVENYFLTILYTFGVLGCVLCFAVYYLLVRYSFQLFILLKKTSNSFAFGGIMFGAVIAFLVNNLTNPALIFDQRIKLVFVFIVVVVNKSYFLNNKGAVYNKLRNFDFRS